MNCEIIYQNTGERWGIFPRDIGEFQAKVSHTDNSSNEQADIIKKSAKIELMSCSFSPDEKNKRHQKALAELVEKLLKTGWEQLPDKGKEWYSLRFYKAAKNQ